MLVLAFDTTSERGGAAIYRDSEPLAAVLNEEKPNYSVTLFQMVERLLERTRLSLQDMELFAVANGPGSFTGIRVGLAAAQAWSKATGRPARGVSVLEALVTEARAHGLAEVLALTRKPTFFLKLGFVAAEREQFPLKVWADCARCPRQNCCDEIAVVLRL